MRTGASSMSAAAAAGVSQMSGLSSEKQSAAAAAMQFPLTQRRKRRVLFTQAQVISDFPLPSIWNLRFYFLFQNGHHVNSDFFNLQTDVVKYDIYIRNLFPI